MTETHNHTRPMATLLMSRQIDTPNAGNATFLIVFLRILKQAGLGVRIVMAPRRSFGNRPWMKVHRVFKPHVQEIILPQSLRLGDWYWSLSPLVWARFVLRSGKEALRKTRIAPKALTSVRSRLGDELSDGEARGLARTCDRHASAITIAEYSSLGSVLRLLKRPTRKATFLHDLFALRAEAFRSSGQKVDFVDITLEQEARRIDASDALFFASANELERLAPLLPRAQSVWVRPEVPAYPASEGQAGAPRGVFLGTRHAGNADAMQTLIDDIWPIVRASVPDAQLWIAGSTCNDLTPAQAHSPGVRPLGRVEDLAELGGPNSIGLAPTRIASGVSIKVAEYLRLGMPCIAYPVALEGFGRELEDLVDVVEGPQAFADRLIQLLRDEAARRKLGARGLEMSGARLDNTASVACLERLIGEI